MTALRKPAAVLAVSSFLVSASALPAVALDADHFGERLKSVLAASQGVIVDWSSISASGDNVVMDDVTLRLPGDGDRVSIDQLTMENVSEHDGGYRVGSFALAHYVFEESGANVTVDGLSISGLIIPGENATGPLGELMLYERAELASASVSLEGRELVTLGNLHAEVTLPDDGQPMEFTGTAESFSVDLNATGEEKAIEIARALGLSTFSGNVEMTGSWSPGDGRASLDRYDITIEDAGTLGINFEVSGYTPDFIKAMQEVQTKMAQGAQEEQSAQGLAMLGLVQQLSFHGATIRFDDDSLTGKVLDYVAKQQGSSPGDISNQAKFLLPMVLTQLNDPEFSSNAAAAVSTYLDNPENLQIRAQPESPVPFAVIAAGAMTAPETLIRQLGVTVTANE